MKWTFHAEFISPSSNSRNNFIHSPFLSMSSFFKCTGSAVLLVFYAVLFSYMESCWSHRVLYTTSVQVKILQIFTFPINIISVNSISKRLFSSVLIPKYLWLISVSLFLQPVNLYSLHVMPLGSGSRKEEVRSGLGGGGKCYILLYVVLIKKNSFHNMSKLKKDSSFGQKFYPLQLH
jgi:hypothetical protein